MRKAGGLMALIAGILAIFATFFSSAFSLFVSPQFERSTDVPLLFAGGLVASTFVMMMAAILLNTSHRWPGPILMFGALVAFVFAWGGGLVAICLLIAIVGSLLTLFDRPA